MAYLGEGALGHAPLWQTFFHHIRDNRKTRSLVWALVASENLTPSFYKIVITPLYHGVTVFEIWRSGFPIDFLSIYLRLCIQRRTRMNSKQSLSRSCSLNLYHIPVKGQGPSLIEILNTRHEASSGFSMAAVGDIVSLQYHIMAAATLQTELFSILRRRRHLANAKCIRIDLRSTN